MKSIEERHLDANVGDACQFADAGHEVVCLQATMAALGPCVQQDPAVLCLQGLQDGLPSEARHIEESLHGLHAVKEPIRCTSMTLQTLACSPF